MARPSLFYRTPPAAHVMTLVDALMMQRGTLTGPLVPDSRGSGYGTWTLGVSPQRRRVMRAEAAAAAAEAATSPVCSGGGASVEDATGDGGIGPFSRVPAFLVRHIAAFVGPPLPEGYVHRPSAGSALWQDRPKGRGRGAAKGAGSPAVAEPAAPAARGGGSASRAEVGLGEARGAPASVAADAPGEECTQATSEGRVRARWGVYRWGEAPLPHLPPSVRGSALAATCTDLCEAGRAASSLLRRLVYSLVVPLSFRVPRMWTPQPCEPLSSVVDDRPEPEDSRRPFSLRQVRRPLLSRLACPDSCGDEIARVALL